jgi:zinc protease
VEAPLMLMAWPTPALFHEGDAELDILADLLDGGLLCGPLRYKHKLVSTCRAHQQSRHHDGTFWIEAELTSGSSPDKVREVVDEALERIRRSAPTVFTVEVAKLNCVSHLMFRSEPLAGRSAAFLAYDRSAGDPSFFDRDVARYRGLVPGDIQRAAGLLEPQRRVIEIVTPKPEAPPAGRLVSVE